MDLGQILNVKIALLVLTFTGLIKNRFIKNDPNGKIITVVSIVLAVVFSGLDHYKLLTGWIMSGLLTAGIVTGGYKEAKDLLKTLITGLTGNGKEDNQPK